MHYARFVLFKIFLAASLAGFVQAAASSELTLKELLDPEGLYSAELSPDGKHIAATGFWGTNHALLIIEIDTMKSSVPIVGVEAPHGLWRYKKMPQRVTWVDNDLLAVDYGFTAESVTLQGNFATMAAFLEKHIGIGAKVPVPRTNSTGDQR